MIYHITTHMLWQAAGETYLPPSFSQDGFIHCSLQEQLPAVATRHFPGQTGLLLLQIDPLLVDAKIIYEDLYQAGELFPHIYGALPRSAVVQCADFPPNSDGSFSFPAQLAHQTDSLSNT
jgi:uncharacterized protein (DUF952 family)